MWHAFDSHRQLDDEDASLTWQVVETDSAVMDLDGLTSDREAQAEPASIGLTPAGKRLKNHVGRISDAAAPVLDLDAHVLTVTNRAERDRASGLRKLEGIVQQVHHGRRQQLRVANHSQLRLDRFDDELQVAALCVQMGHGGAVAD